MIGFTVSLTYNEYSAIADLHNFQFTVTHALGFSVSTSRLLATDLNTKTSASNPYEVFLPFLVQSCWNLGTQLKLFWTHDPFTYSLISSRHGPRTENTASLLLHGADNAENKCHVSENIVEKPYTSSAFQTLYTPRETDFYKRPHSGQFCDSLSAPEPI
jgi:hypothetical protein